MSHLLCRSDTEEGSHGSQSSHRRADSGDGDISSGAAAIDT